MWWGTVGGKPNTEPVMGAFSSIDPVIDEKSNHGWKDSLLSIVFKWSYEFANAHIWDYQTPTQFFFLQERKGYNND